MAGKDFEEVYAGVSRRKFLQGAALTGAAALSAGGNGAEGQATYPKKTGDPVAAKLPNPIVPNFQGEYGGGYTPHPPKFEVPKRPMGSTGLQVSILGVGGFHLGTAKSQEEVNNMVAKAMDYGINFFDNAWEISQGIERGAGGNGAERQAGQGDRDDQGVYPWAR